MNSLAASEEMPEWPINAGANKRLMTAIKTFCPVCIPKKLVLQYE